MGLPIKFQDLNEAIASYLRGKGYAAALEAFQKESEVPFCQDSRKFNGFLEKAWTNFIALENKNAHLQMEIVEEILKDSNKLKNSLPHRSKKKEKKKKKSEESRVVKENLEEESQRIEDPLPINSVQPVNGPVILVESDGHVPLSMDEYVNEAEELILEHDTLCPSCGQIFGTRIELEHHITQIHPELLPILSKNRKSEIMKCSQCDRVFNHRNSLVYHMRSHTGERPHRCDHCGKSFFATSALKVHMRLHSGEKPYKCEHCDRHFRQWGDLKYHVISIHSNIRQYQCEFCGKNFARKYSLIVHRRIHTGERNYKCDFCEKRFRAASYLQNHRRIHTGEKPYSCGICGKPFRVRSDMKRHMGSHAREVQPASDASPDDIKSETAHQNTSSMETNPGNSGDVAPTVATLSHNNTNSGEPGSTLSVAAVATLSDIQDSVLYRGDDNPHQNTLYVWPVFMN